MDELWAEIACNLFVLENLHTSFEQTLRLICQLFVILTIEIEAINTTIHEAKGFCAVGLNGHHKPFLFFM